MATGVEGDRPRLTEVLLAGQLRLAVRPVPLVTQEELPVLVVRISFPGCRSSLCFSFLTPGSKTRPFRRLDHRRGVSGTSPSCFPSVGRAGAPSPGVRRNGRGRMGIPKGKGSANDKERQEVLQREERHWACGSTPGASRRKVPGPRELAVCQTAVRSGKDDQFRGLGMRTAT